MQNKTKLSMFLILMLTPLIYANYTCSFKSITNNNPTNIGIGQNQLSLNVVDLGNSQAAFQFLNTGTENAVIEEVLFEDGSNLLSFSNFQTFDPGVNFLVNNKNLNLPGGNEPPVNFTESFGFFATPPAPQNGVGKGESLGIAFTYSSASFDELINSLDNNQLRVGIHVIAYENGGSESFTNCPPPQIPLPSSIVLACIGLATVSKLRRKRP